MEELKSQKLEDAAMFDKMFKNVDFLVGDKIFYNHSLYPYDKTVCEFLNKFSLELSKKKYNKYSDLKALSFWCRKSNIEKLKKNFNYNEIKKGKGLIFHVTPSNVPTNFVYSLIFGLVTGNSNIIKVPSKKFIQIDIICYILKKLTNSKKFNKIKKLITILRFKEKNDLMRYLSKICDVRIIWGGNKSIRTIREFPLQERAHELTFADRYSICLLNADEIKKLKNFDLKALVKNFFNDTYLFDQNACSSPHMILWKGKNTKSARKIFWLELSKLLKKSYIIPEKASIDKFSKFCVDTVKLNNIKFQERYENHIYTFFLGKLEKDIDTLKGKWGYFYEYEIKNFNKLNNIVGKKCQTLTYYGISKKILHSIFKKDIKGIDRVVPVGRALDMSLNWDGFDINNSLTRVIDIK